MAVRALLFDLFGTVVHFAARVPIVEVAGTRWLTTMPWLRPLAEEKLPALPFDTLLAALLATTEEIVRERPPEYREVASAERFRRALAKLGITGEAAASLAQELSLVHMQHLASTTFLPPGYAEILAELHKRYRLALVSNFDHGPTARRILQMHAIDSFFEVTLVSDEVGRRKPHRAIFAAACAGLHVSANEALFIGDNPKEDIAGARAAGIKTVWVSGQSGQDAQPGPEANFVIRDLTQLSELCEGLP